MTVLAKNKDAYFNYTVEHELDAGIVLTGQEVKSIKAGQVSLKGAHVTIHGNEAFLVNAHVSPYKYAGNISGYEPTRSRKLLLKRKEISSLIGKYKEQGMAVVPLEFKAVKGLIKVRLGIGRGKKKYDKRASIRKREDERKIGRAIQGRG
ncbi:MAG: SsrA-binding protein SmpB [Candidatus Doudnabacteria bacterium]|nr:SsrA-binding protein SmpB [bacterium]MDZ4243508.1 SsrA-binding protein SmpB [Candidatus Doudnabacteria bacterium]